MHGQNARWISIHWCSIRKPNGTFCKNEKPKLTNLFRYLVVNLIANAVKTLELECCSPSYLFLSLWFGKLQHFGLSPDLIKRLG
jgi:hypothetical protein